MMTVLEQAILATDLASYFEKRDKFKMAADDGEIDWQVIHQSCNEDSSNRGWEPVSIIHYTRPGSSIKWPTPNKEAALRHVKFQIHGSSI